METYGYLLPQELEANREKLATPYDATSEPFQIIIDRFEEARTMDSNLPITEAQLINSGIVAIKNTGVLELFVDLWNDKPLDQRNTWLAFKQHFQPKILEYQKGRRTHNNPTFGLMALNHQHDTLNSTLTPVSIFEANQTAMANMAATLQELLQQLATMHERYAALAATKQTNQPTTRHTPNTHRGPITLDQQYCWTHGYGVSNRHTSATCSHPAEGHQTNATRSNTVGGSAKGLQKANAVTNTPAPPMSAPTG